MPEVSSLATTRFNASEFARQTLASETALLLSSLVKTVPNLAETLRPGDLRRLLSDPVRLSALVREASLQSQLSPLQASDEAQLALQDVLARVSPRHLSQLLMVLEREGQPAIDPDPAYGASTSLGEPGNSRISSAFGTPCHAPPSQHAETAPAIEAAAYPQGEDEWRFAEHDYDWQEQHPPVTPAAVTLYPWAEIAKGWPLFLILFAAIFCLALFALDRGHF